MTNDAIDPRLNSWPDTEALVRSYLAANLTGVNVRTETDATFGTSSASPAMTLPLVLVQCVPGGSLDPNYTTADALVDVDCFAVDRAHVWPLAHKVNALMLALMGTTTDYGAVDMVSVDNGVGLVDYANPNLRRTTAAYRLATRAQASA